MIRKAIDTLSAKLSEGLSLSNGRLETLCLLVIGIASVRTVNLSHICGEMPTQAKVESTYRRLQRFFQHVDLGEDWSARLVVRMLGLSGNWNLCLDRTNWKIGRKEINLLVLAIATRRYRVPLMWTVPGKAGNSSAIMDRRKCQKAPGLRGVLRRASKPAKFEGGKSLRNGIGKVMGNLLFETEIQIRQILKRHQESKTGPIGITANVGPSNACSRKQGPRASTWRTSGFRSRKS